jgi:hypothetical protein
MSLPALLFTIYVIVGLVVGFVALISRRRTVQDPTGGLAEPPLFWLLLLVWPVMIVVWFARRKREPE